MRQRRPYFEGCNTVENDQHDSYIYLGCCMTVRIGNIKQERIRKGYSLLAQAGARTYGKWLQGGTVVAGELRRCILQPALWRECLWVHEIRRIVVCRELTDFDRGL